MEEKNVDKTTHSTPKKERNPEHFDLNSSHLGLYQQLYVPQFNAPNPNMIELEKLYKRYPKRSKPLFILNIVLIFILLFNISHKFNSLSWNIDNNCDSNAIFLGFGVMGSLIWLTNCFLLAYSLAKRYELAYKIYIFIMGIQLAILGLGYLLRISWAFDSNVEEICKLWGGEVVLFAINAVLETVLIVIFMFSAIEMRKILLNMDILRGKILTPLAMELNLSELN